MDVLVTEVKTMMVCKQCPTCGEAAMLYTGRHINNYYIHVCDCCGQTAFYQETYPYESRVMGDKLRKPTEIEMEYIR